MPTTTTEREVIDAWVTREILSDSEQPPELRSRVAEWISTPVEDRGNLLEMLTQGAAERAFARRLNREGNAYEESSQEWAERLVRMLTPYVSLSRIRSTLNRLITNDGTWQMDRCVGCEMNMNIPTPICPSCAWRLHNARENQSDIR